MRALQADALNKCYDIMREPLVFYVKEFAGDDTPLHHEIWPHVTHQLAVRYTRAFFKLQWRAVHTHYNAKWLFEFACVLVSHAHRGNEFALNQYWLRNAGGIFHAARCYNGVPSARPMYIQAIWWCAWMCDDIDFVNHQHLRWNCGMFGAEWMDR